MTALGWGKLTDRQFLRAYRALRDAPIDPDAPCIEIVMTPQNSIGLAELVVEQRYREQQRARRQQKKAN
jgi:hypothetical protein